MDIMLYFTCFYTKVIGLKKFFVLYVIKKNADVGFGHFIAILTFVMEIFFDTYLYILFSVNRTMIHSQNTLMYVQKIGQFLHHFLIDGIPSY